MFWIGGFIVGRWSLVVVGCADQLRTTQQHSRDIVSGLYVGGIDCSDFSP